MNSELIYASSKKWFVALIAFSRTFSLLVLFAIQKLHTTVAMAVNLELQYSEIAQLSRHFIWPHCFTLSASERFGNCRMGFSLSLRRGFLGLHESGSGWILKVKSISLIFGLSEVPFSRFPTCPNMVENTVLTLLMKMLNFVCRHLNCVFLQGNVAKVGISYFFTYLFLLSVKS